MLCMKKNAKLFLRLLLTEELILAIFLRIHANVLACKIDYSCLRSFNFLQEDSIISPEQVSHI